MLKPIKRLAKTTKRRSKPTKRSSGAPGPVAVGRWGGRDGLRAEENVFFCQVLSSLFLSFGRFLVVCFGRNKLIEHTLFTSFLVVL